MTEHRDIWADDLLDRKKTLTFFTNIYLVAMSKNLQRKKARLFLILMLNGAWVKPFF